MVLEKETILEVHVENTNTLTTHHNLKQIQDTDMTVMAPHTMPLSLFYCVVMLMTVRLRNTEGVPPENSQGHSLEQAITLALILKSHSKSAAKILKNWIVDFPMAPDVSTATDWKIRRRPNSAYLAIFLTSAASATDPAASAARIRFEDASVLTHVASQMRQRPRE